MNHAKRTTVTASRDALDTVEAEARRRGVSVSAVLAEAVEEKAAQIRAGRRPRVGLGRSTDGRSARELASDPVARAAHLVALVLDTGPLLAALDAADPDHEACAALLTEATEDLVVPTLVLAELDYWCQERLDPPVWLAFLDDVLAGAYRVEAPTGDDLQRCRDLQERYADLAIGVVDSSVLALVERLGEDKLATLDHRHFSVLRPAHAEALTLLP